MGGVWCKADREQTRSYSSKNHFNATITRWTDHVRQAYRKPKTNHRPPRPPQKPLRSHGRLTISHPQLLREESSDGWRTATLMVPETAPVPPPRKKRKRNQDLTRTAWSMDDLNRVGSMNNSTISLPDKYPSETGLDSRSCSSTLVVTPVLESRLDHSIDYVGDKLYNKENVNSNLNSKIEEEKEADEGKDKVDIEVADHADEIIPIEKETLFSSRTLLQSNLGYIDKLSVISEVSAESGFDDRIDIGKSSERSESVTSAESISREPGLNILAHIQNINNVSQLNEANIKEKTAISKKEWLQNILIEEPEPYFISRDTFKGSRRGSDSMTLGEKASDNSGQPNSLPTDHLHLMNRETETSAADFIASKTPPPSPDQKTNPSSTYDAAGTNHSVLLELLQKNSVPEDKSNPSNPFIHKEESIFLTNTKTNIIYKSLSSDKLTDDYEFGYLGLNETDSPHPNITLNKSNEGVSKSTSMIEGNCALDSTNPFNDTTPHSHLSDYSFQTPKLVESDPGLNSLFEDKRSNVVSSFDFKEITKNQNYVAALKDLQLSGLKTLTESNSGVLVNGVDSDSVETETGTIKNLETSGIKYSDKKIDVKEQLTAKDSVSSSRRSSITDSLHEFEMSIYDMLKESKKNRDSSDDEDSLKPAKTETRQ